MKQKIIILGGSGYIGRELSEFVKLARPDADIIALSSRDIDLTDCKSGEYLDDILDSQTILYICAGIKKQLGDNLTTFRKNISMTQNILESKKISQCKKTIFLSSAEVYGENINSLEISETTPCLPSSYYGLSKKLSEELFALVYKKTEGKGLILARMPLVYGPRESQNIYGPSGFASNAKVGQIQTLWGDGTEKRNFLFIDDLVKVLFFVGNSEFEGIVNIATSMSNNFQDIIEILTELNFDLTIKQKARTKGKVDQGYDISCLKEIFQGYKPHSLKEGMEKVLSINGVK